MHRSNQSWRCGVVLFVFALAACTTPRPVSTEVPPSAIPSATIAQPTNTVSLPPTPTVTPTPLFLLGGPLDASNITGLQEVARLGQGKLMDHAWSPDSRYAALSTGAGVFLVNAENGELLFSDFSGNTLALSFSADSQSLAIITDKQVIVYNLPDGGRQYSLDLGFSPNGLAFRQDTSELIIVGAREDVFGNSTARVIARIQAGSLTSQVDVPWQITEKDFNIAEDGSGFYNYSSARHQFEFFNLSGQRIGSLPMDSSSGAAKTFNAGYFAFSRFASDMSPGPVQVYNTNGQLVASLDTKARSISPMYFSRDGKTLNVGVWKGTADSIKQYSIPPGTLLSTSDYSGYGLPSPDLSHTFDGAQMRTAAGAELGQEIELSDRVGEVIALSPDHSLLVVGYEGRDPQGEYPDLWGEVIDTRSLQTLRTMTLLPDGSPSSELSLFSILANGRTLALHAQKGKQVFFWDITSGEQLESFDLGFPALVAGVSADGQRVLAADKDGNIKIWERSTATPLAQMSGVKQYYGPKNAAFSPDGQIAALSGSDVMVIWDLAGNKNNRFESNGKLAISPDGSLLAVRLGNDSLFVVYNLPGRTVSTDWKYEGSVDDLAFSLTGDLLMAGVVSDATRLVFLDPPSGQVLFELPYYLHKYAISADGTLIATTSYDGTLRLWGLPARP